MVVLMPYPGYQTLGTQGMYASTKYQYLWCIDYIIEKDESNFDCKMRYLFRYCNTLGTGKESNKFFDRNIFLF